MKRLRYLVATLAFGVAVLGAPSATAITYGFVDTSNTYSNTDAFIVKSPTTGNIYPICSGTLIASGVFLTASHCTAYFTDQLAPSGWRAYVSFDQSIPFGALTSNKTRLLPATAVVTNPNYNQAQSDSGDIGALVLATASTRGSRRRRSRRRDCSTGSRRRARSRARSSRRSATGSRTGSSAGASPTSRT